MQGDWEEVKKLAADFQKAQLADTSQRLTERNCIDIVKKLINLKLIDVVFTTDGKEFTTAQHLVKEIEDELYIHNGRINLVDLAQILNVDFTHVEAKAKEVLQSRPDIAFILGQLITRDYLDSLAEDVNEKLQQLGQISINELAKTYDLPGDFLEEAIHERLGTIIQGSADPYDSRHLFTDSYVAQNRARIRGVLSAITRPVQLSQIIANFHFPERLFYSIVDELINEKWVSGSLTNNRADRNSFYIPTLYSRAQNEWVDRFYKQNGYIEYDSLTSIGITDPKSFISKRYKDEKLVFLHSCCFGEALYNQVEIAIEDALSSDSWVDITHILPSFVSTEDTTLLISTILKALPSKMVAHVFSDTIVVSDKFIQNCFHIFEPLIQTKAEEALRKGELVQHYAALAAASSASMAKIPKTDTKQERKEERRKKAAGSGGGKSGGGQRGRESKTKSVKSHKRSSRGGAGDNDSADEDTAEAPVSELAFIPQDDLIPYLREKNAELQEAPDELTEEIAQYLYRPLTKKYQEVAESLYRSSIVTSASTKKKHFTEIQDKVTELLHHIHLCDKGLKVLPDELQSQLQKHLLKTLATDLALLIVSNASDDQEAPFTEETPSQQNIQKLILKLPDKFHEPFLKLTASLSAKTTEAFFDCIDSCLDVCDFVYKKLDKKKEKLMIQNHRALLASQLEGASDVPLALHLAALLTFLCHTNHILHIPGKMVPSLIRHLDTLAPPPALDILHQAQELVMKKPSPEENPEETKAKLEEMLPRIKQFVSSYKKHPEGH